MSPSVLWLGGLHSASSSPQASWAGLFSSKITTLPSSTRSLSIAFLRAPGPLLSEGSPRATSWSVTQVSISSSSSQSPGALAQGGHSTCVKHMHLKKKKRNICTFKLNSLSLLPNLLLQSPCFMGWGCGGRGRGEVPRSRQSFPLPSHLSHSISCQSLVLWAPTSLVAPLPSIPASPGFLWWPPGSLPATSLA